MIDPKYDSLTPYHRLGAVLTDKGVRFRIWAPDAGQVELIAIERNPPPVTRGSGSDPAERAKRDPSSRTYPLQREPGGYFSAELAGLRAGALYQYRVDGHGPYPDPCSRFQPQGPHGPSCVIDAEAFCWSDQAWTGLKLHGQVMYELHIGAFTPEGTFDAARAQLPELAALGITCVELMPVCEFPGRWNWGYDGVDLFAPYHGYGDYDALKRFVDAAHQCGIGVILDVVYNHFGPDGNYLPCFSRAYFTDRHANDWGDAINFDGPDAAEVREFIIANACYWVREFHLDGLRLDATQSIHDASPRHVLADLSERVRACVEPRSIILVAENEPQRVECIEPVRSGGYGLDAMWNDDFHHSARVALTGTHDGYFHDYRGHAQEFISAIKRGFLYQGQHYYWQKQARGTPLSGQPPAAMIHFIQNHDQVGNTLDGIRISNLTSPARLRAMTALLLLTPATPLLFMGQEFGASTPFRFFADQNAELSPTVHAGRRKFLSQFESYAGDEAQATVKDPADEATFRSSVLDLADRERNATIYKLHKDLLALRRSDPLLTCEDRAVLDGAVLGDDAFVLRFMGGDAGDRLLLINLRDELDLRPAPEPLLAPPRGGEWELVWSSDDPCYGGIGSITPCSEGRFRLAAESAVLLRSKELKS